MLTMTSATISTKSARTKSAESPRPAAVECAGPRTRTVTTRVTPTLVSVSVDGDIVGFVEAAGPVFVTLAGAPYDRAVEVGQSLDLAVAVALLEGDR